MAWNNFKLKLFWDFILKSGRILAKNNHVDYLKGRNYLRCLTRALLVKFYQNWSTPLYYYSQHRNFMTSDSRHVCMEHYTVGGGTHLSSVHPKAVYTFRNLQPLAYAQTTSSTSHDQAVHEKNLLNLVTWLARASMVLHHDNQLFLMYSVSIFAWIRTKTWSYYKGTHLNAKFTSKDLSESVAGTATSWRGYYVVWSFFILFWLCEINRRSQAATHPYWMKKQRWLDLDFIHFHAPSVHNTLDAVDHQLWQYAE